MNKEYPILEFDYKNDAIIAPSREIKPIDIPEYCVLPIQKEVIDRVKQQKLLSHVRDLETPMGLLSVYSLKFKGQKVIVAYPGLCAPLASSMLEALIALGCRKFIACGTAGVLDKTLLKGRFIVPYAAIRDEGVSYHYIKPSREIDVDKEAKKKIEKVLKKNNIEYKTGKTWTTDAIYRETKSKIVKRKSEGCLTVEMECASLIAVCKYRKVKFGQLFMADDDVSGDEWKPRYCNEEITFLEKLFWLGVESCLSL